LEVAKESARRELREETERSRSIEVREEAQGLKIRELQTECGHLRQQLQELQPVQYGGMCGGMEVGYEDGEELLQDVIDTSRALQGGEIIDHSEDPASPGHVIESADTDTAWFSPAAMFH